MNRILLSLALFWFIGVAPGHAAPPIKVGAVSALGAKASFPEASQAAKAYFDAFNEAGGLQGRRIEYVSLDEGTSPDQAAQAARQLIDDPEVVALVGGSGLLDCPVNAKAYAQADLLSLQGASVAADCFASSHIVPLNNGPYYGLENAISFAHQQLKSDKVCVSLLDLPGMVPAYRTALARSSAHLKWSVTLVEAVAPSSDFSAAISKHLAAGCETIIFTGHEPAVLQWLQAALKLPYQDTNWLFLTPAYSAKVASFLPATDARVYAMAEFEPWQTSILPMLAWKRAMRSRGLPQTSLSQGGYVAAQLFVRALATIQGPITRRSVSQALRELPPQRQDFLGMPFEIGDRATHAPNRASLPMVLNQGRWRIAHPRWIVAPAP